MAGIELRVAAYGVVIDGGSILLARWAERALWTLPGGGLEPGEHPEDGARREVEEETGYLVELDGLLGVDSVIIPPSERLTDTDRPLQALRIVYRARVVGGALRDEVGGSTDAAAWVPLDEIAELDRVDLVDVALRLVSGAEGFRDASRSARRSSTLARRSRYAALRAATRPAEVRGRGAPP